MQQLSILGNANAGSLAHHIRYLRPPPRIADGPLGALQPKEWPVFCKHSSQGAAVRAPVEPNRDSVFSCFVLGGKEPEEELIRPIKAG